MPQRMGKGGCRRQAFRPSEKHLPQNPHGALDRSEPPSLAPWMGFSSCSALLLTDASLLLPGRVNYLPSHPHVGLFLRERTLDCCPHFTDADNEANCLKVSRPQQLCLTAEPMDLTPMCYCLPPPNALGPPGLTRMYTDEMLTPKGPSQGSPFHHWAVLMIDWEAVIFSQYLHL